MGTAEEKKRKNTKHFPINLQLFRSLAYRTIVNIMMHLSLLTSSNRCHSGVKLLEEP